MQSWSRQPGICAFCLFRSQSFSTTSLPKTLPRASQYFYSKSSKTRDNSSSFDTTSLRRPIFRRDAPFKRPPGERSRNARFPSDMSGLAHPSKAGVVISFSERIQTMMNNLRQNLKSLPTSENPKICQLDALDPDGTAWIAFEQFVAAITKPKREKKWSGSQKKLHDNLMMANMSSNSKEEMTKILHFEFIEQVLSAKTRHVPAKALETDLRYPAEWYMEARSNQREVHLHVGPTNSGKTYHALKKLEESGNGFYAGPLRLLAHEVYSRFKAKGVPCDLITGDDVRLDEGTTKLYSSTVEMVDCSRYVDVAVIDEIQMMASEDRGWAWTRAFLGANAREVHLCGETRVVPLIRELVASIGDTLHIHQYERLNPLKVMSRSLRGNLKNLKKGDCVVSFSVVGIHALKRQIEKDTGRRVAIVYGSLPPEIRAQQAALFNEPENDYDFLVASDAIGMGLNLNVKRIIFESVHKYNGAFQEQLSVPQIKQIAGRAGRYRSAYQSNKQAEMSIATPTLVETAELENKSEPISIGLVTCLEEADLPIIKSALETEAPPIRTAGILPPANLLDSYVAHLPPGVPFEFVLRRMCDQAALHPRFTLCKIRDQVKVAQAIESVAGLTASQRFQICAAPAQFRAEQNAVTRAMARCIADQKASTIIDIPEIPLEVLDEPSSGEKSYLDRLEFLHKSLILFLWLSYRFVTSLRDQPMAMYAKTLVEEKINTCLIEYSANPVLRKRLLAMRQAAAAASAATALQGHSAAKEDSNVVEHVSEAMSEGSDGQVMEELPTNTTGALPVSWSRNDEGSQLSHSEDEMHGRDYSAQANA